MIKNLQSLRFVFIMLIVLSHIIGKSFDFGGECGVSFFFVLSGFVLFLAYGCKVMEGSFRTRPFVCKQLLKFYPLHLLTMAVILLMDARIGRYTEWYRLLPNVFLVQSWIPIDRFFFVANGSSWFLCDVLFFYVVFRKLFLQLNHATVKQLATAGILLLGAYVLLAFSIPEGKVNALLYASPATRIIEFVVGILLFRAWQSASSGRIRQWLQSRSTGMSTLVELAITAVIVAAAVAYPHLSPRIRCASLYWPIAPAVVFVFATIDRNGGLVTRLLHQPWMVWLGNISFEIYLLHMIVIRITQSVYLQMGMEGLMPAGWSIAVNTVLTILLAYPVKKYFVDKIYGKLINRVI
ncbi:MAG: acyltransferase [Prevotella sp.]|nr:acyltransferase [Prevotella sp.]